MFLPWLQYANELFGAISIFLPTVLRICWGPLKNSSIEEKKFDSLQISSELNDGNGDVEAGKKINNAHSSSDNNNYVDDNENNDKLGLETDLRGVRTDAQKNGKASLR